MFKYPHGDLHGLNLDWFLEAWRSFQQSFQNRFTASSEMLPIGDEDATVNVTYDPDTEIYDFHFGIPSRVKPSGFLIGYQSGTSGTTIPTGTWLANPPAVSQGDYLWTKTQVIYNDGQYSTTYSCARQGIDGTGTGALYFKNVPVSVNNGDIATISDTNITSDHVVAEIYWAIPSAITSNVTWTSSAGSLVLNGNCVTATTANVLIIKKIN